MTLSESMERYAVAYAEKGLYVIPLHTVQNGQCSCKKADCNGKHSGKHPRYDKHDLPNGLTNASCDVSQVTKWWTRWPDANIGIATGRRSNLVVVDIDGESGESTLRGWVEEFGEIASTWEVFSGNGRHLYFRYPGGGVSNSVSRVGNGIDVRGDLGYIVAPPSLHYSGRTYQWHTERNPETLEVAEVPEFLLDLINGKTHGPDPSACCPTQRNNWDDVAAGVPEGQRDESLFRFACSLVSKGLSRDDVTEAVLASAAACTPPFPESEALVKVNQAFVTHTRKHPTADSSTGGSGKKPSKSQMLIRLVEESGADFFVDQVGGAWACIRVNGHNENIGVRTQEFREYLTGLYFDNYGDVCSREVFNQLQDLYVAQAKSGGKTETLSCRVSRSDGSIFLDIGDPNWTVIEVTRGGWRMSCPPRPPFKRFAHMKALPLPQSGGDIREILQVLPISDRHCQNLLLVWLPLALIPDIPRPGLILHGPPGSGKTFTSETLAALIDPVATNSLTMPRDRNDLIQIMDHHYLPVFDNISELPKWISDTLCRTTTGLGHSKRVLYTDDADFNYQFQRSYILNGIEVCAKAPDLLDRSILIGLRPFATTTRKAESELISIIESMRPRVLGAMLDALSRAMEIIDVIETDHLGRLADWHRWALAMCDVLGIGRHEITEALRRNKYRQNEEVILNDPLANAVVALMEKRSEWQGSPTELLNELSKVAETLKLKKGPTWPKAANVMSQRLKSIIEVLASAGIEVSESRVGGSGQRVIHIVRRCDGNTAAPATNIVTENISHSNVLSSCDDSDDVFTNTFLAPKKEEGICSPKKPWGISSHRHNPANVCDLKYLGMTIPGLRNTRRPSQAYLSRNALERSSRKPPSSKVSVSPHPTKRGTTPNGYSIGIALPSTREVR